MDGIQIKAVSKAYQTQGNATFSVLSGFSMALAPGELVSLTGDSGSGKSTLAKLLLGLESPDAGEIWMDGKEIGGLTRSAWRPIRRNIQGVFQDSGGTLNPRMSVLDNMTEALRNMGVEKKERAATALELMEKLGLERNVLDVPARNLSGGQQRRVALVRGLSIRPRYLVLDEITSGLDLLVRNELLETLQEYRTEYNIACLFITHDMQVAYRISDRILKMENGLIIDQIKRR